MGKTGKAGVIFSGFWLLIAVYVVATAYRMGLGTVKSPGCGFMPFLVGLGFMGFCIADFAVGMVQLRGSKEEGKARKRLDTSVSVRLVIMVVMLAAYGLLVEDVGFLIMTAAVLLCLFRVAGCRWVVSIIWGPVIAVVSYYLFVYLGVMLPAGLLRF